MIFLQIYLAFVLCNFIFFVMAGLKADIFKNYKGLGFKITAVLTWAWMALIFPVMWLTALQQLDDE